MLFRSQLDEQWEGTKRFWVKNETPQSDKVTAAMTYWLKKWALNPLNSYATRGLIATDEFGKSVAASQVATGRGFRQAFQDGDLSKTGIFVKGHMDTIFEDGIASGKITDADVLEVAKNIAFQSDIDKTATANIVDKGFTALQSAADDSAIFAFFFPFTKAAYNSLEVTARHAPIPGIRRLVPRYQRIMAGEMGEAQRLQLQSQVALGNLTLASGVTLGAMGMATGYNPPPGVPKTSILIPSNNKDGYVAVPYGRLEPFASILGVTVDLVNSFRAGAISEGDYERAYNEMLFSIGMASFDKTFISGMLDLATLMNFKNYGRGDGMKVAKTASNIVGDSLTSMGGQASALFRMVMNWSNPYQTIQKDKGNLFSETLRSVGSRYAGGVGQPIDYNEFTGEPKMKVGDPGGNYFQQVGAMILNEIGYPGSITTGELTAEQKMLHKLGYEHDSKSSLSTYEGVDLSPAMQSKMRKAMHDHGFLSERLKTYFASDRFKKKYNRLKSMQGENFIKNDTGKGTTAAAVRQDIHGDIREHFRAAKSLAADNVLAGDPDFQKLRQELQGLNQISALPSEPTGVQGAAQGLITWATGQPA